MEAVCLNFEVELNEFNGEQDHVHLLIHYPPKVQLSKLINWFFGIFRGIKTLIIHKVTKMISLNNTPMFIV